MILPAGPGGDSIIKGAGDAHWKFWKWPLKGTSILRWWVWQWWNVSPKRDQSITYHFDWVSWFYSYFDASIKCRLHYCWYYTLQGTTKLSWWAFSPLTPSAGPKHCQTLKGMARTPAPFYKGVPLRLQVTLKNHHKSTTAMIMMINEDLTCMDIDHFINLPCL